MKHTAHCNMRKIYSLHEISIPRVSFRTRRRQHANKAQPAASHLRYNVYSNRGCLSPRRLRSAVESHCPSPVPSPYFASMSSTRLLLSVFLLFRYKTMMRHETAVPMAKERLMHVATRNRGGSMNIHVEIRPKNRRRV